MTWSYDESESTGRDRVRGMIGDIDTEDQLLSNETIDAILVRFVGELASAVECVRRILAKIARDIDTSGAGITSSRAQKTQHYRDLLADLQGQLGVYAETYTGGVSVARATTFRSSADDPGPWFTTGQHDNSGGE